MDLRYSGGRQQVVAMTCVLLFKGRLVVRFWFFIAMAVSEDGTTARVMLEDKSF